MNTPITRLALVNTSDVMSETNQLAVYIALFAMYSSLEVDTYQESAVDAGIVYG